jgi:hypothetical protein
MRGEAERDEMALVERRDRAHELPVRYLHDRLASPLAGKRLPRAGHAVEVAGLDCLGFRGRDAMTIISPGRGAALLAAMLLAAADRAPAADPSPVTAQSSSSFAYAEKDGSRSIDITNVTFATTPDHLPSKASNG